MTFSLGSHSDDTNLFISRMDDMVFNDGPAWQPTKACWNGIGVPPNQGDISLNHSAIKRAFKSAEPYLGDQVDLIYFAGHGVHAKDNLQDEKKTMFFHARDIASPTSSGSGTDRLFGGYSCSSWGHGLKWAIFGACSILDIVDDLGRDTGLQTPGYNWAKVMLGYPRPMHAIFGFRDASPSAPNDSYMLDDFFSNVNYDANMVAAWLAAGLMANANWACAIYDRRFEDEYLPGSLYATDPPGYDTTLVDLSANPDPVLTFSYSTKVWFIWTRENIDFVPWYHDLNGSITSYAQIACADLGLVNLPREEQSPDRVDSRALVLHAKPDIADGKLQLAPITASPQCPNVRLKSGWRESSDKESEVSVYCGNRLSLTPIKDEPEKVVSDATSFASHAFRIDRRRFNAVCLRAVLKTDMKGSNEAVKTSVGMYSCHLLQDYKGIPVYSSDGDGIQVLVGGSGIFKATAKLNAFKPSGSQKLIVSASAALASVQTNQKDSGSFLHGDVDAELVYYPISQARERLLIPAWRIASNDDVCVVDGYTGKIIEPTVRLPN